MKGILEFNLPEETDKFTAAQKGTVAIASIYDFYWNYLNRRFKHENPKSPEVLELYEEIRGMFSEEFNEFL